MLLLNRPKNETPEVNELTNTNLLKAEYTAKGYTQRSFCKKIGMALNTFNLKLNNRAVFDTTEVERICEALEITDSEQKCRIFLYNPSQI